MQYIAVFFWQTHPLSKIGRLFQCLLYKVVYHNYLTSISLSAKKCSRFLFSNSRLAPFNILVFSFQFTQLLPPSVEWYNPLILSSAADRDEANNSPGEDELHTCILNRTKLDHGFVTRILDSIHAIFTWVDLFSIWPDIEIQKTGTHN